MNSNLETKKMIETNVPTEGTVVKQETPTRMTTTMILNDLENGIGRDGIKEKYNLEAWMVVELFKHPTLKGKKVKKKRALPFEFIDDTVEAIDPNQTTIEQTIEEEELETPTVEDTMKLVEDQQAEEFGSDYDEDEF
tara:strand:+ start:273 stop:683 length:411 start_codon:yes stop_codon:yes gene_type:complete